MLLGFFVVWMKEFILLLVRVKRGHNGLKRREVVISHGRARQSVEPVLKVGKDAH